MNSRRLIGGIISILIVAALLALLFGYYDVTNITPDTATIDISIRNLTNSATNANFSVVVLGP